MKDRIKAWLDKFDHDRYWLADKLGIEKRTVDNWLSASKDIPPVKQSLIERLIEEDEAGEARRKLQLLPQAQIFSVETDLPTFRAYNAAALSSGKTLEQWAISELNAAADAALRETNSPPKSGTGLEAAMADMASQIDAAGAKRRGKSAG